MPCRLVPLLGVVFLSLLLSRVRAETLEALLAPAVDAEVQRVAALPPVGEPWDRNDFLVYAGASSTGGPSNPEVLVTSATFLAQNPGDHAMLVERADAWRQLAQYSRALAELRKIPAAESATAEVQFLRAQILCAQGQLPDALAAARAVAGGNEYYQEKAAALIATLEARQVDWEKLLRPTLTAPPANPDPNLARLARECGADNLAHDLARRILATRPGDATARDVLLTVYAALEPDTPALTLAVHRAAAPLAAAAARAHPTERDAWRSAVDFAATVLRDTAPAGADAFATLLREAKAAGGEFPREEILLAICQASDDATLRELGDAHFGFIAADPALRTVHERRRLSLSPVQTALDAARADPTRGERWRSLLALARTEIEAGRLPGRLYSEFLAQAAAAGQPVPTEQTRATLYAAETNYEIVEAIRAALLATRDQPDLEATFTAVARRITAIAPESLGFRTSLLPPPGLTPLFSEDLLLAPELRVLLTDLKDASIRAQTLYQLGLPGEALVALDTASAEERATPDWWLLRTQLLQRAGRPQEALLALDRARFLAGKPIDLPAEEEIDTIATGALRAELLSACQQAEEKLTALEDRLARSPDEAESWGRLALAWSEGSLRCVPKALAAAARARELDPRQRDATRAEFNALALQLSLLPAETANPIGPLLANRLDQFTDADWLVRVELLRTLPHDTRKTLAVQWLDELRPKRDRISEGKLIEQALKIYGIKTHADVEAILPQFAALPAKHPLQFERKTAQLVDEAFLRQRGWFIGEPAQLSDDQIEERNLVAGLEQSIFRRLQAEGLKSSGPELSRDLEAVQAKAWACYERLRLQSHEGFVAPADWTGTAEEFHARVIATGRFGPATATAAPTAGCVPYFPGLTSEERKLATQCIALVLETSIGLDHGRLTTLALELYRRQETRDRDLVAMQSRVQAVGGTGDLAEDPALAAGLNAVNARRYDEAAALIRPLQARNLSNYYLEVIAGSIANAERRYDDGMRHFARARAYVAANPTLTKRVDDSVAVVRQNLDRDRTQRRTAIQARLAYLDEFLAYLHRDARASVDRAKTAVSSMADLKQNTVTYYNADSLQHEADKLGLMHDNAKSRLQEIIRQAEELEAERDKLKQELSRL